MNLIKQIKYKYLSIKIAKLINLTNKITLTTNEQKVYELIV